MFDFRAMPTDFQCTNEDQRRYQALREQIVPKLRQYAVLFFKYKVFGDEFQDIMQGLEMLAVWGVKVHDPTKGSLNNWLGYLARSASCCYWENRKAEKRKPFMIEMEGGEEHRVFRGTFVQLPSHMDEHVDERLLSQSVEESFIARESVEQFYQMTRAKLSGLQQHIFDIIFDRVDEGLSIFVRNRTGREFNPLRFPVRLVAEFYGYRYSTNDAENHKRTVVDVAREVLRDLNLGDFVLGEL